MSVTKEWGQGRAHEGGAAPDLTSTLWQNGTVFYIQPQPQECTHQSSLATLKSPNWVVDLPFLRSDTINSITCNLYGKEAYDTQGYSYEYATMDDGSPIRSKYTSLLPFGSDKDHFTVTIDYLKFIAAESLPADEYQAPAYCFK